MISNKNYKGKWVPKLINNPNYYESDPYKQLASINAVGFELWTMSSNIVFDNIIITDDANVARNFAAQTFDFKTKQEIMFDKINNPEKTLLESVTEATEERPWLWALLVLVLLIPIILISIFCFGKKSSPITSNSKKTDDVQQDDQTVCFILLNILNLIFLG